MPFIALTRWKVSGCGLADVPPPSSASGLYFETYAAYGFKDEKVKYFLSGAYSFNGKSIYSFPLNFLRVSFQHDTKIPGQELQFVQEDNFLLSFKRGDNNKWLYNDIFTAEYVREFGKNYQLHLWLQELEAAGRRQYRLSKARPVRQCRPLFRILLPPSCRQSCGGRPMNSFTRAKPIAFLFTTSIPFSGFVIFPGIKGLDERRL